jgi:hypothetical protein
MFTRRGFLRAGGITAAMMTAGCSWRRGAHVSAGRSDFDVIDFGAAGDGQTLDSPAIQRAIDAAASAGRARVIIPGRRRYLIAPIQLRSNMELHLADDAELLLSPDPAHYPKNIAAISASGARGLIISGTGTIDGQSPRFMDHYDERDEWWRPKKFRPRMFQLGECTGLELKDFRIKDAPSWSVHLVGCRDVLIDRLTIRNALDVPNCDGIDPDHCSDVEIRNCDITCGDDAIVIKTTRQPKYYGGSRNIHVHDCVLETQDSGLKIGTETTADIRDVLFEHCQIRSSCRGLCIQLRDEGSVHDITFRDITFTARYHSNPWWGRGEAISLTAIPRRPETKVGTIHDIRLQRITGRAENSVRISGSRNSRIRDVMLSDVKITLERWTKYEGGVYDNRPVSGQFDLEKHETAGYCIRNADDVTLSRCSLQWGENPPAYFTHAVQIEDAADVKLIDFSGEAAQPGMSAIQRSPAPPTTGPSAH